VDGIRIVRRGGRYLFNYRVMWEYWRKFQNEPYDVVIDDMNKIPFFTPLYVHRPLAVIIHHLFEKSIFREAPFPFAAYVFLMEKLGVAICRRKRTPMLVVSPSTRNELLARGFDNRNIEYVFNCVDHALHKPDPVKRSATPLIGYFGRLKKYKSTDHLLYAFAAVRKKMPDVRLVIIGEGDFRPELERIAKKLDLGSAVEFTGFVDEKTKVELLQQCWFMVNTSAKEGWGLTVIEANACATTVIGSNVPGLRDAIQDGKTGLLYEYGNINQLAEKIFLLLENASLRQRLSEEAYRYSMEFDWDRVAEQTIVLLENIRSSCQG
jgi:glycosyltransferase involved in cell wall biosynthesis